jgi:uncharacterized protein YaiI (UPF0178 family)
MRIWVDADACPGEIKDILFRAASSTTARRDPMSECQPAVTLADMFESKVLRGPAR